MVAGPGARVWVPHETGWAQATVLSCGGGRLQVKRDVDGKEQELDGMEAQLCNGDDVEDMTALTFLHEPGVLWNLQSRYQRSDIYTYTGSILIAVNPFKPVPHLYGNDVIDRYRESAREQLPPHVYATACAAYRNMMRDGEGQAILVTGESGAGKTETAKLIMACLTHLGASHGSRRSSGAGGQEPHVMSGVEQKILESNPLLEAFGNAKTLRNNNSSRFGKYVEIFFDPAAGGAVTGAAVRTYLLERSRVVAVNNPERSFHIFYQLVYGASPKDRAAWRLPSSASDFAYLARSTCYELPGQSNAEEYQHTRRAMSHIGLSEEQQQAVLATVAAVLHMGNVSFVEDADRNGAAVASCARAALEAAAELLGVEAGALAEVLTTRQIQTPEGSITTPLSAQAAADARDSMAKVVYARLFDWLVAAVNAAVDEAHNGSSSDGSGASGQAASGHLSIGLLDIYGFESFEVNDLEQLCINLTNEKLQQHFNEHVFKWEQAEYGREGVDWSYISFQDNADVLELLEGRMGIMDLLDEASRFPKATADDLELKYGSSTAVSGCKRFSRPKRPANSFCIDHYAGSVTYSMRNFLDKNRDYVVAEHQSLLGRSTRPLLQELFGAEGPATGSDGGANGIPAAAAGSRSQFQFRSVSSQCRRQLAELMSALSKLQPHYVRCIKPNPSGSPGLFDPGYSLQQLRCGGVMEAVRIACAGYAYRRPYAAFLEHFWQLCPEPVHVLRRRLTERQQRHRREAQALPDPLAVNDLVAAGVEELRPVAAALLQVARLDERSDGGAGPAQGPGAPQFHLGHTKVFLRATSAATLERHRLACLNVAAARIQAHWSGRQVRRWYHTVRLAVVTIQSHFRGLMARREAERLRRERAAITIQRAWRSCVERLRFLRLRSAATAIQSVWRGVQTRRAVEELRVERAAVVLQTAWRRAAVRREYLGVLRYWRAAVKVQAAWRGYAARQLYLQILPLHRAAISLQRIWRSHRHGSQLSERLRSALLQYWIYSKAAVIIQAAWRGKVARKHASRLRLERRRARFLASKNCFASEPGAGPGALLPPRFSPQTSQRGGMTTPLSGPRTYSHTMGGSAGKALSGAGGGLLASARSVDSTPLATAMEVVRSDDVAAIPDRDSRMQARLAELRNFKLSPLVQYWQHKEAAVGDGVASSASRKAPAVPHSRPRTADPKRRYSMGVPNGSPMRFGDSPGPFGSHSPQVVSPPDTDDRATAHVSMRRGTGGRGRSATALEEAVSELSSRGGTGSTLGEMTDFSSRGGSATTVEEAAELSSGALSCEPSYGQLLGGRQDEQVAAVEVAVEACP